MILCQSRAQAPAEGPGGKELQWELTQKTSGPVSMVRKQSMAEATRALDSGGERFQWTEPHRRGDRRGGVLREGWEPSLGIRP